MFEHVIIGSIIGGIAGFLYKKLWPEMEFVEQPKQQNQFDLDALSEKQREETQKKRFASPEKEKEPQK